MRGDAGAAPAGEPAGADERGRGAPLKKCRAAVFLNGDYPAGHDEFYTRRFAVADLRIAADGGYAALRALDLRPEVLVGDFDSLPGEALAAAAAEGVEIVRLPVRKDETDAEAAVALALARGCAAIDLMGASGGALDHELGNVAVLRLLARRGAAARLLAPSLSVAALCAPARIALSSPVGTRVSLLCLSDTAVVTLTGLEYPLTEGVLRADVCLGVSNAVRQAGARVDALEGEVLVVVFASDEAFAGPAGDA